ncbi:cyclin-H-like [Styela clava]
MYHSSTQRKYWTFKNDSEISKAREQVNRVYRQCYVEKSPEHDINDDSFFLTVNEERQLLRWYDDKLIKEFCRHFNPQIPLTSIGTACQYMKRLYLRYSVMDYNPKLMMLAAIWLSCKTDEFNISMDQFVWNVHHLLKGEARDHGEDYARKYGDAILSIELILIKELNFHLTVHNPLRPFEGFIIDVKTRYAGRNIDKIDMLRKPARDYLYTSFFTDAQLLFTPSQIALASLLSVGSKQGINLDAYVTEHLLKGQPQNVLDDTVKSVKKIRSIIKKCVKPPSESVAMAIEQKLQFCRNRESDPLTEEYARVKNQEDEERDRVAAQKWRAEAQRQKQIEMDLLAF